MAVNLPAAAAATDANITLTDVTTNNASTSKHGFLKKLDNTATHYMDGTGAWSTPATSGGLVAWCEWTGTTTGTNAPNTGSGVTSVQRVSAGVYTVTFSSAFADTNYCAVFAASNATAIIANSPFCFESARTTTTITIQTTNFVGTIGDATLVSLMVIR